MERGGAKCCVVLLVSAGRSVRCGVNVVWGYVRMSRATLLDVRRFGMMQSVVGSTGDTGR